MSQFKWSIEKLRAPETKSWILQNFSSNSALAVTKSPSHRLTATWKLFILGPTVAMSGKLPETKKKRTNAKNRWPWWYGGYSAKSLLSTTSKRDGGLVVKAAPFRCVGHPAFLVVGMVAILFQWSLSTPFLYCDSVGFLNISPYFPTHF